MKNKLLLGILLLVCQLTFSQFGAQEVISTQVENPRYLQATDLDEDGITDLIAVGQGNKIYWLRGLDTQGNFDTASILYDTGNSYSEIKLLDMDGDGLEDIVFLHGNSNSISYLKKVDNSPSYAPQQLLIFTTDYYINNFIVLDMDEDGDLDILTVGFELNSIFGGIYSYENIDGLLQYGNETQLYTLSDFGEDKIFLKDIDGDGLEDIVGYDNFSNNGGVEIFYLKNNVGATFETPVNLYQFDFLLSQPTTILSFDFVDINTDGLDDIMFTTERELGNQIDYNRYWLENLDGQGAYSDLINSTYLSSFYTLGDVDNDQDVDIVFAPSQIEIGWVENSDGLGGFLEKPTITSEVLGLRDIVLSDINGDSYLDVISASTGDNKIAWYPNRILNINQFSITAIKLYPNPTQGIITIDSNIAIQNAILYTLQGTFIQTFETFDKIDLGSYPSGIYFLKLMTENGQWRTQKIIKQ